jgi:hypothetical protein
MQRAVVLAVVAGVIAAESLVVAAGLPRYGCAEGFLLFDSREFPGLSDEVVCVPDSGVYAPPARYPTGGRSRSQPRYRG